MTKEEEQKLYDSACKEIQKIFGTTPEPRTTPEPKNGENVYTITVRNTNQEPRLKRRRIYVFR